MIAGFSGTASGMKSHQCIELKRLFQYHEVTELHHGMCIGADFQANYIAQALGIRTVGHPPINKSKFFADHCDHVLSAKDYLARNHDIVDASELLFIGPDCGEYLRSGTWATKRYAEKVQKPFIVVDWRLS